MSDPCKRCGGLGYIPVRGEAMAADPCGCADWQDDDETDDTDDTEDDRRRTGRVAGVARL